jgi:hypothetical protein
MRGVYLGFIWGGGIFEGIFEGIFGGDIWVGGGGWGDGGELLTRDARGDAQGDA